MLYFISQRFIIISVLPLILLAQLLIMMIGWKRDEEKTTRDWQEYKLVYGLYRGAIKWNDLSDKAKAIVRGEV